MAKIIITIKIEPKARPTSMFDPSVFSQFNAANSTPENDPYAALRGIPAPVVSPVVVTKEEPEQAKEFDFPQSDEDDDDPWQGKSIK